MDATNPASPTPVISLSDASRDLDRALLRAPGGFAWWYLDHVDEAGDGLVLIWSFGLPFLPDYLGSAREGRPVPAGSRPSLNLVLYEGGRPSFYLLQEYEPEACEWSRDRWRFGDSHFELVREGPRATLRGRLDCAIPRSTERLRGTLTVEGPQARFATADLGAHPDHEWSPVLGPAHLEANLRIGERAVQRRGPAYHDRNGGTSPLDRLGIAHWTWGRWVQPDQVLIYYVLWPETDGDGPGAPFAWGVKIDDAGHAELQPSLQVEAASTSRATYGMRHARHLDLSVDGEPWLSVRTERVVDDGPFYLRTLVRGSHGESHGIGEWVAPARVDRPWQRPFVRMRVHHTAAANSAWLPLFSGPRQGRLQRLFTRAGA